MFTELIHVENILTLFKPVLLKTHLPIVPHVCVNWVIISSGNGLAPVRRQAITWTNVGLLSIGLQGTNSSEIWIESLSFLFKKMHLKMSSAKMGSILSRGRLLNDGIWRYWSGWALVQVKGWCLTAPSNYLNLCWPIISGIHLRAVSQGILNVFIVGTSLI